MIVSGLLRWLAATAVAVLCGTAHLIDGDPDALQLIAEDVVAAQQDAQRVARAEARP